MRKLKPRRFIVFEIEAYDYSKPGFFSVVGSFETEHEAIRYCSAHHYQTHGLYVWHQILDTETWILSDQVGAHEYETKSYGELLLDNEDF